MNTAKILNGIEPQGAIPNAKDLYKDTLTMAWPAVLESFLISMTGFVDTIMVSTIGSAAIAAIGLTDQPKFIGLAFFFALATAISAIVARRKGEGDRESANRVMRMGLFFGTIICVIVSVVFFFGADLIITIAGSEADTHQDAVEYFQIIVAGFIFTTTTLIINASQRGAGNTKISMVTNVSANIVNVVFNYLLIGGNFGFPQMGVKGAALATVIGSAVGCVISIYSATKSKGFIFLGAVKGFIASKRDIKASLNIGTSAFIEQIFLRIGFFLFAITVASLGTTALSAHFIGMKFISISFSFADGLAVASVALVGRSLGQKRPDMAKLYGSACQRIGFVCSCVISMIFFFGGRSLFSIFTDEVPILDYGDIIMKILCYVTYVQIAQVSIIGCLRGAGDTKFTAITSLISVTIIRPVASWFLCGPCGLGLVGVWLGLSADQTIRFLFGWFRFKKGKWLQLQI